MTTKSYLYILLAFALSFVACEEPQKVIDTPTEYEAMLQLTSDESMTFAAEGGKGVITYTAKMVEVTRTEDTPAPEAECEAEWVTNLRVAEDITFTITANEGDERSTKVVVTYADKSFEVAIIQSAKAEEPMPAEPKLTLDSEEVVEFAAEGGQGEIAYTLENAVESVEFIVTSDSEWITNIAVAEKISFSVVANEGDEREGKISASYGELNFEVKVKQAAKPQEEPEPEIVEFTANYFDGEYYGDYYSPGIGNYYLHLSDNGFQESGYALPNSTYYRIDLYSDYFSGSEVEYLQLPYGTYTLDLENKFEHGTFSVAWSKILGSDAEGNFIVEKPFEAGELTVDESGATLRVTIEGQEHIVTYKGATLVADKRSSTGEDVGGDENLIPDGALSTLTSDYKTVIDDHMLIYAYYGDYYSTGLNNWTFAIWPNDYEGDHIQFDIMNDSSSSMCGTYTVGDANTAYSFLKGHIEDDGSGSAGYMNGSWYYTDDGVTMAPFVDGKLTITDAGGGNISVDFTVTDDIGNTIRGNWRGTPQQMQL